MYHSITFDINEPFVPPKFVYGDIRAEDGAYLDARQAQRSKPIDCMKRDVIVTFPKSSRYYVSNTKNLVIAVYAYDANESYIGGVNASGDLVPPTSAGGWIPIQLGSTFKLKHGYKYRIVNWNAWTYPFGTDGEANAKALEFCNSGEIKFEPTSKINTFDAWRLVPSVRPHIVPPEVKTKVIDVPGRNGVLDLSEALTGGPIFKNRVGEWEFIVLNEFFNPNLSYNDWLTVYSDVMNTLHGKTGKCYLEDDPDNYYTGRFFVKRWTTNKDYSHIVIGYDLNPFKQPGGGF